MNEKKVKAFLKEKGFNLTRKGKPKDITVKQEDEFLRVSLQHPAYTLTDKGGHINTKIKNPTGKPSREYILEILEDSGIEKTQTVQVDYEIKPGVYSAFWTN